MGWWCFRRLPCGCNVYNEDMKGNLGKLIRRDDRNDSIFSAIVFPRHRPKRTLVQQMQYLQLPSCGSLFSQDRGKNTMLSAFPH